MTANEPDALSRMTRINLLFDLYGSLLTEKQQACLKLYYQDDLSLGEIAYETGTSRQGVYAHINRAEQMLEIYEGKLDLLTKQKTLLDQTATLIQLIQELSIDEQSRQKLMAAIDQLDKIH